MSACIAHITRITQVTLKNDKRRVSLLSSLVGWRSVASFRVKEPRAIVRVVIPFKDQEFNRQIMLKRSSRISALRCRQLSSQYSLAAKLAKILKYAKWSHRSTTNNASFIVFQCDLCDAGYVGYIRGHLHTRVDGHKQKASSIYKKTLPRTAQRSPERPPEAF